MLTNELGDSRYYFYDLCSNLIKQIDRNERVIEYVYDNLNRETQENWRTTESGSITRTMDFGYDFNNRLTSASDPGVIPGNSGDTILIIDADGGTL